MSLKHASLWLVFASCALQSTPLLLGQSTLPSNRPQLQPANFEQFAVYWTAEPGWKTELLLRNNLPGQSLAVTPALRTADGTETVLRAISINPNDIATVDLNAVITNSAPQLGGAYGSIVFRYTATVPRALYAAVMIELPGTPIEFHLDALDNPATWTTGSREGIWWLPRDSVKDWLILTNRSGSPLTANLNLYDATGKAWQQSVVLGVRQMKRVSVRSLLQQAGLTGSYGGIKIEVPNGAGFLDSAHFVYDDTTGFLALMKMFDHDPNATLTQRSLTAQQWTTRAPMLALTNPDPALAMPAGTALKPAILLRNASANAYAAQITFNSRSGATTGKSSTAVSLQAYATAMVDVAALQANGTIPAIAQWAYVSITAPIKPDDLLAVAVSYDATGRFGAQTPFTDQVANRWEGGKWEVDASHDTLIAVGNAGTTASKAQLTFYYNSGQGKYQVEQTLSPDQQFWLDMGKAIANQIPDKNGKTIPSDVMWGTYELRSLSNKPTEGLFEGKLVVDKTYGYAAHGCMLCCGYGVPYMDYNPLNLTVGSSGDQWVWAYSHCDGIDEDITNYFSSWWTGNTQIATANYNLINAIGVGSTTVYTSGYVPAMHDGGTTCPNSLRNANGPVNVLQPYQVEPIATSTQGSAVCPSGQQGWSRTAKNQLQTQGGTGVTIAGITMADTLTVQTPNSLNISGTQTGSFSTASDGTWPDTYFVCSSLCPGTGTASALQNWTWNGLGLPHVNGVSYSCTSITIDGY